MPWEWDRPITEAPALDTPGHEAGGPPLAILHAWPYRSLPKRGFVFVIGGAYVALLIPIGAFVGTLALWWLLLPGLAAIAGLYWFIDRSYRDGEILEALTIWPDQIRLDRHGPHGKRQHWEANIYWVTVQLHPSGGPVKDYLTLKGAGREVELGAFLHEDERPALFEELTRALTLAKSRRGA